ncbi:MAG: phosphoribosylglycinamide formyltransferase [Pseudomonadota bacterium]
MRIGVLASHEGTTLQAVIDACSSGQLAATVGIVISNNSSSGALRRAAAAGIEGVHISSATHPTPQQMDTAVLHSLQSAEVEWVLLLGYMKKLGLATLNAYRGKILNTHPALLPKYGGQGYFGRRVHEAVLAAGETQSGATVHLVDNDYDTGPLLAQVSVPVKPGDSVDSLEARVKTAEQKLLLHTLKEMSLQACAVNS